MSEDKQPYAAKAEIDAGRIVAPALHPAEVALLRYIRRLQHGTLTVKVQHGLPEWGEEVRASVKFNQKGGG